MRPYYFLVFLLSYCISTSNAQKNLDYVINLEGDTLYGDIEFAIKSRSPRNITIKFSNEHKQKYNTSQIEEFGIRDEKAKLIHLYRAKAVEIDILDEYKTKEDTSLVEYVKDIVFLRVLVNGKITLYDYEGGYGKTHYFVALENAPPEELIYKKVLDYFNRHRYNVYQYKSQLMTLMKDCSEILPEISNLNFKVSEITNLIVKYNTTCSQQLGYQSSIRKGIFSFYASASYANSDLRFTGRGSTFNDLGYINPRVYHGIAAGLTTAYTIPRYKNKVSVIADLQFRPFQTEAYFERITSEVQYYHKNYNVELLYINFNAAIRYKLFDKDISPFLEATYTSGFLAFFNQETIRTSTFYSNTNTESYPILDHEHRIYEKGWLLGGGMAMRNMNIVYRFGRSSGMSAAPAIGSKFRHHYLTIEYQFAKVN